MNSLANISHATLRSISGTALDLDRLNAEGAVKLVELHYQPSFKIPHDSSFYVLREFYKNSLRTQHLYYFKWKLTNHGTLGLVVKDATSPYYSLYAISFNDGKPRRLASWKD